MANTAHTNDLSEERVNLGERAWGIYRAAKLNAILGLVASVLLGFLADSSFRRFYFSYLAGFAFFLSIALGALFFVLIQHLTRAGWSVTVRRIPEALAGTIPVLAVLSSPILLSVAIQHGDLYRWALPLSKAAPGAVEAAERGEEIAPEAGDPTQVSETIPRTLDARTLQKRAWLNPWFFILRVIIYFVIWSAIATWYWKQSALQDKTGDPRITLAMQRWSGGFVVVFALTLTLAAIDLFMSLDPHWFSTIFGGYYFAGAGLSLFATLILVVFFLQKEGYLTKTVTVEHYHDMGKFLFAFVFIWGYVAFSQFMLLWYASIPEEVQWYARRGATTARGSVNSWSYVALVLLFCHLLIPFGGLLSRHVKRVRGLLVFWAGWLLVFHYLDLYWVIMPEYGRGFKPSLIDLTVLVGIGGAFTASFVRNLARYSLRPISDPRLPAALALENF